MSARSRIIIEFNNKDFINQLSGFKDIATYFGIKENYCLVYCNKEDEKKVLDILNTGDSKAYISNEYLEGYNF